MSATRREAVVYLRGSSRAGEGRGKTIWCSQRSRGGAENIHFKRIFCPRARVRVGGGEDDIFFVDTAGVEVIVDTDSARKQAVRIGRSAVPSRDEPCG